MFIKCGDIWINIAIVEHFTMSTSSLSGAPLVNIYFSSGKTLKLNGIPAEEFCAWHKATMLQNAAAQQGIIGARPV